MDDIVLVKPGEIYQDGATRGGYILGSENLRESGVNCWVARHPHRYAVSIRYNDYNRQREIWEVPHPAHAPQERGSWIAHKICAPIDKDPITAVPLYVWVEAATFAAPLILADSFFKLR